MTFVHDSRKELSLLLLYVFCLLFPLLSWLVLNIVDLLSFIYFYLSTICLFFCIFCLSWKLFLTCFKVFLLHKQVFVFKIIIKIFIFLKIIWFQITNFAFKIFLQCFETRPGPAVEPVNPMIQKKIGLGFMKNPIFKNPQKLAKTQ